MSILICGRSVEADPCIGLVIRAIQQRGGTAEHLDVTRYPSEYVLDLPLGSPGSIQWMDTDRRLDLGRVAAVWVRHIECGATLDGQMRADWAAAAAAQSTATMWSLLESFEHNPNIVIVDPPHVLSRSFGKLRQLQLATHLNMDVPKTIVTNDPRAVNTFAQGCESGVIAKMVDSGAVSFAGETQPEQIFTQLLTPAETQNPDGLQLCPMIFQENLVKSSELRVTVVGQRVFVAEVDSSCSELGRVDWRADPALVRAFRPCDTFSADATAKLFQLLDMRGLNFATADFIRTVDGREVFLEINSISDFHFVERYAQLDISGAVADLLLNRVPLRVRM